MEDKNNCCCYCSEEAEETSLNIVDEAEPEKNEGSEVSAESGCCCCSEEPVEGKISAVDGADFDDDQDNEESLCCSLFSQKIPEKSDTVKKTRKTCC